MWVPRVIPAVRALWARAAIPALPVLRESPVLSAPEEIPVLRGRRVFLARKVLRGHRAYSDRPAR